MVNFLCVTTITKRDVFIRLNKIDYKVDIEIDIPMDEITINAYEQFVIEQEKEQ